MYNEELKKRYIEENKVKNEQLEARTTVIFNRIEEYEESYGKDLCTFTIDEILAYYKTIGSSSLETLMMVNSYLKMYTDWCRKQGMIEDGQNHYEEIKYDLLQKECVNLWLKENHITNRAEILGFCKQLLNYSDKVILLGIYEGIYGIQYKELANIRESDIKGNTLTTITGRNLTISPELKKFIKRACNEYEYIPFQNGEGAKRDVYYYDKADDRAIKKMYNAGPVESVNAARAKIAGRIRKINEYLGTDIGTKELMYSAVIEFINQKLLEEPEETGRTLLDKYERTIEDRWITIASPKRFVLKYGSYFIR